VAGLLRTLAILWLLKQASRLLRTLTAAAILAALWPVTLAAVAAATAAWSLGWPAARLYRAAARSAPVLAVWAVAAALRYRAWRPLALAPVRDWQQATGLLAYGRVLPALLLTAPLGVPAGLLAGGLWWQHRTAAVAAGTAGRHAYAPAAFDQRQWRRQARAARGLLAAPGPFPLVTRAGFVPAGAVIRAVGRRWTPVLAIPFGAFARHMVIVGASGTGKTNLMIRLWAGWYAAALTAANRGKPRPLLCALDCKGGPDARAKAARTSRMLRGAGARRVAVWPDDATLSLWALPPRELAVLLHQMTEHGDGAAAYYADVEQAVLMLAVCAPGGSPGSAADFLARLDPAWLEDAYAADPAALSALRAAKAHAGDIALRYATLLGRLGPALDGPGRLRDADAWYFILEGTSEPSVAEAQAMAITELIAHAATDRTAEPRAMLLAADDYSAVSRRVPLSNLYERGRSLGLGVMVSAQSWQGLGKDDDERYRIAATADGGVWVMETPYPQPLAELAGTRRVLESARKLLGTAWGDEGSTRVQHAWTADPDLIRRQGVGQACYIHRGTATFMQIARPKPNPLSLPAAPARPHGGRAVPVSPPRVRTRRPGGRLAPSDGPPTLPLPAVPVGGQPPTGPLDDVLGPAGGRP
jgi:hypothetical protein